MAVDPNIDELLERLSKVKPLPQTEQPFRTVQAQSASRLRDASLNAFQSTPRLADAVQNIQQGGVAQTGWKGAVARAVGSPVGKAVLGGLNVIDMPRRAVITTMKEVNDIIDVDPNTRGSLTDLKSQFRDPSFGFGRVAPMEGWKGRLVGFIGDVALDPTTYLTVGGTVPLKAVARGAGAAGLRAAAKVGAQDVALRAALGTKNVTGREGRFALANLVKQYGGTAEEVSRVASRGKSAVPTDIAQVMGLQRNGLYMFGSRVRIPGSGLVGSAIEHGLVKTRLGITNSNIGKKLQYLYTPRGASGRLGDLSKLRADMASGRLKPEEVDLIMTQLNGAENGRRVGASYGSESAREANAVANLPEVREFNSQVTKFIESGTDELLSPSQIAAKRSVEQYFARQKQIIEGLMRRVDPSWQMPVLDNYVPHVTTDKFRRWKDANLDNPWVQRLEAYLSVDVLDMKNSLAARYLTKGVDFLDTGDIIKTGSIDEINALFRKHLQVDFDMFETDIGRIMFGYADTVRGAAEVSTLLSDLKSADFIRLMRTTGEVDPEYLRALERMSKDKFNEIERLGGSLRAKAASVVDEVKKQFGTDSRTSVASRLAGDVRAVGGEIRAAGRMVDEATAATARVETLLADMDDIIAKQKGEVAAMASLFDEKNLVMDMLRLYVDESIDAGFRFGQEVQAFRRVLSDRAADTNAVREAYEKFQSVANETTKSIDNSEKVLSFYKMFGDDLGPVLKDIYGRIRNAVYDGDTNRIIQEGERFVSTGDEKLNTIISTLLKPFDNQNYANAGGLGDEWVKTTVASSSEAGRLLRTIPDVGGAGTKAKRASMGRAGGKRTLTIADARQILVRGSMVGDNPEDMSDAFYFLTLSEMKAAYDNAGGGDLGLAAQNGLAKELRDGRTHRAKMWLEAREAVQRVTKSKQQLDVIGSRRVQAGGKYSPETLQRIDSLRAQLDEAATISDPVVADAFTKLGASIDELESKFDSANVMKFITNADGLINQMNSGGSLINDENYIALFRVATRLRDVASKGETLTIDQLRTFYNSVENFATVTFGDTERVRSLTREISKLERFAKESLELDKQFGDGVTGLTGTVVDAGTKLSNFLVLHVARMSKDAIQRMAPSGVEVGEAIWGYAVSGAARQQMQTMLDFGRTVREAENVMRDIRDKVFSAPVRDRAAVLREEVENLPIHQRSAVYDVVGNLSFIEQAQKAGRRASWYYRNNGTYVAARDAVLDIYAPGWKNITDDIANLRRPARVRSRAVVATGAGNAAGSEVRAGMDLGVVGSDVAQTIANARNRQRNLTDTAPNKLREYVAKMRMDNQIDSETMSRLISQINEAEQAVKVQQSMDQLRPEFGPEFPNAKDAARTQRELSRAATGAKRAETETFGLARAFSKAIETNNQGSTLSNRRIDEFFVYLFGDGKVRIGNGESATSKPVAQRTAEEATFRSQMEVAYKNARRNAATRRKDGMNPVENALAFWDEMGQTGTVNASRAKKVVMESDSTKRTIADLKKIVAGMKKEPDRIGLRAEIAANEQRISVLSQRVKDFDKELAEIESSSKQLVTLGAGSENAMRTIAFKDAQFGRMYDRVQRRTDALKELVVDPEAAGNVLDLSTGIGKRSRFGSGPFGYLAQLNSEINELDAAIEAYEKSLREVDKIGGKISRSAQKRQNDIRVAEAIANNPTLQKRVDAGIENSKSVLYPRDAKWLDASLLGQEYVQNPQAGVRQVVDGEEVVQPARIAKYEIPEEVASLLNKQRAARLRMERIEGSPMYTRALQMSHENDFFKVLAKIDLDRTALEFPETLYTAETLADLRRFASNGSGVQAGLNPDTIEVRRVIERDYNEVAGKLLADKEGRYAAVVDGRRATRQAVVDSIRSRENKKFGYVVNEIKTPETAVEFVDKSTGAKFVLSPDLAPQRPEGVKYPFDVELDSPIYLRTASRDAEDYASLLDPSKPVTVFEMGGVVTAGKNADNFYDPANTVVTFASSSGAQRVYRMNEMGVRQQRATSLNPEMVFNPAEGRGLTKETFEAVFSEPLQPGSAKARKMRADIDKAVEVRSEIAERYNDYRKRAREATTEKARRNNQALAAQVQDVLREQDELISEMEIRYRASLPERHMAAVKSALNVLEYFKRSDVRSQLGFRVERRSVGIDPATARETFEVVPATDEEALDAFKRYVEALEYGKTRKYLSREKIVDPETNKSRTQILDVKEPMVLDATKNKRLSYLNKQWKNSAEKRMLDEYKSDTNLVAAISVQLETIRNGGEGADLYRAREAAEAQRDLLQTQLGIKERNVRKALRDGSPSVAVRKGDEVATVARGVADERKSALDNAIVSQLAASVPAEQRAAVVAKLDDDRTKFVQQNFHQTIARDFLIVAEAAEAAKKAELDGLLAEEGRIMRTIQEMNNAISGMPVNPKIAQRIDTEFMELRLRLNGNQRYGVKGLKQEIADKQKEIADLYKQRIAKEAEIIQERSAVDAGFYANLSKQDAESRMTLLRETMDDMRELRKRARKPTGKSDNWTVEFDDFVTEVDDLLQRVVNMPDGPDTGRLARTLTGYVEAKAAYLRSVAQKGDLDEMQKMVASGRLFAEGDHVIFKQVMDDGFQKLIGGGALTNFNNLQMRPEVEEVLRNMQRLRDPAFVREMRRWTGPYTQFFKAWALATPGFHVRNSVTNAFMLVAAGGRPAFLGEAAFEFNQMYKALKSGKTAEAYIASLPFEKQRVMRDAYDAMLGSGVGQVEEVAFDSAGLMSNNPWTRLNRRAGVWVEQHSRFMLAYDGIKQGLDVNGATARVRKFLFDYEDLSTLDATMRSIMPFWMWMSRNFPLTIQNIYMNPRPYQFYANLRRNIQDEEETKSLPQYLLEAGAFALPGGSTIATPDLGFNRLQADTAMLTDPLRLASNVNPLLRVPVETMLANKQFFRNKQFSEAPVEAGNPIAAALSAVASPFGMGGTNQAGDRVVNEKLYYALRNLVPVAAQFERFIPSTTEYQQRGSTNPLLGFVGAPVREFTPEMRNAELLRRLAEIRKLQRAQPKEGEQ